MDNKKFLITVTFTLCMLIFASAVLIYLEIWVRRQETQTRLMAIDIIMVSQGHLRPAAYAEPR